MQYEEKKHFYQVKGFYISCFLGLFAILCVIMVRDRVLNQEESSQNLVADLGEHNVEEGIGNQNNQEVQADSQGEMEAQAIQKDPSTDNQGDSQVVAKTTDSPIVTEAPTEEFNATSAPKSDTSITGTGNAEKKQAETEKAEQEKIEKEEAVTEEETVSVLNSGENEQGLTWPIKGEIIMNYSMDKGVYFATLGQYKVNPAILIQGKEGDEVVSACDCKITKISERNETGLTVVAEANGYKFIYGQIQDVQVKKGQVVKEGSVLGKLAKPSRYYTKEGCSLYFQIKEDGKSVNPLLFLQ